MARLISTWEELDGLVSEDGKYTLSFAVQKNSTKLLQKFGFDVEIANWDKEN